MAVETHIFKPLDKARGISVARSLTGWWETQQVKAGRERAERGAIRRRRITPCAVHGAWPEGRVAKRWV